MSQTEPTYGDRFKRSIDPHYLEFWVRFGAGTALVTAALNLTGMHSPAHIGKIPTLAETVAYHDPDVHHRQPALVTPETNNHVAKHEMITMANEPDFRVHIPSRATLERADHMAGEIYQLLDNDPSATLTVFPYGMTSDESFVDSVSHDANLGKPSDYNVSLGYQYVDSVLPEIETDLKDELMSGRIKVGSTQSIENLMSSNDMAHIDAMATSRGLNREAFLYKYNYDVASLNLSLQDTNMLVHAIDDKRGADFTVIAAKPELAAGPCDDVFTTITTPGAEHIQTIPASDGWRIDFGPGFFPPLPRRKRGERASGDSEPDTIPTPEAAPEVSPENVTTTLNDLNPGEYRVMASTPFEYLRRQAEYEQSRPTAARHDTTIGSQLRRGAENVYYSRVTRLTASAAALLVVLPGFSEHRENGRLAPTIEDACTIVKTETGTLYHWNLSPFLIPKLIDRAFGDDMKFPEWNFRTDGFPDEVTTIIKEHNEIEVDSNGTIVHKTDIPAQSTTRDQTPKFDK